MTPPSKSTDSKTSPCGQGLASSVNSLESWSKSLNILKSNPCQDAHPLTESQPTSLPSPNLLGALLLAGLHSLPPLTRQAPAGPCKVWANAPQQLDLGSPRLRWWCLTPDALAKYAKCSKTMTNNFNRIGLTASDQEARGSTVCLEGLEQRTVRTCKTS